MVKYQDLTISNVLLNPLVFSGCVFSVWVLNSAEKAARHVTMSIIYKGCEQGHLTDTNTRYIDTTSIPLPAMFFLAGLELRAIAAPLAVS